MVHLNLVPKMVGNQSLFSILIRLAFVLQDYEENHSNCAGHKVALPKNNSQYQKFVDLVMEETSLPIESFNCSSVSRLFQKLKTGYPRNSGILDDPEVSVYIRVSMPIKVVQCSVDNEISP